MSAELRVLGAGFSYPDTVIDNRLLVELNAACAASPLFAQSGIAARRSSLPIEYLRGSGNDDVSLAPDAALESPSQMGARAARMALERAGIAVESVGLLLADCVTPWETCPSEAARIGNLLGFKGPAYDLTGSGAAFPFVIDLLARWKDERVPDYVLFVSTNALTQRVRYRLGTAGVFFGDGSGAMVISTRRRSERLDLKVEKAFFEMGRVRGVSLGIFGDLAVDAGLLLQAAAARARSAFEACFSGNAPAGISYLVGSQIGRDLLKGLGRERGVPESNCWSSVEQAGCCMGASAICGLAERWESLRAGDRLAVIDAGAGAGSGFAWLRV